MAVTPQRMTLADFLKLPEVKPARELHRGCVEQRIWRSGPASAILAWLGVQVFVQAESRELAQGFTSVRLIFGENTYVPDLSVYLWDRVPEDADGMLPTYFTSAPDLVAEILSPGQTDQGLLERCRAYLAYGVTVAMFVDPIHRSVYVLRPGDEIGPLREGDAIDITDVLPGFKLTVRDLFARIRARPARRQS